jgi:hypothetical protein
VVVDDEYHKQTIQLLKALLFWVFTQHWLTGTNQCCVKTQDSEDLNYNAAEA